MAANFLAKRTHLPNVIEHGRSVHNEGFGKPLRIMIRQHLQSGENATSGRSA